MEVGVGVGRVPAESHQVPSSPQKTSPHSRGEGSPEAAGAGYPMQGLLGEMTTGTVSGNICFPSTPPHTFLATRPFKPSNVEPRRLSSPPLQMLQPVITWPPLAPWWDGRV